MILHPWRSCSKAESVSVPAFTTEAYAVTRSGHTLVRPVAVPRVVQVPGGWLALGCYLPWTRQTELIDRHRKIARVILPGDWPAKNA